MIIETLHATIIQTQVTRKTWNWLKRKRNKKWTYSI